MTGDVLRQHAHTHFFSATPGLKDKREHAVNNSSPSKWFDFMAACSWPLCLRNVATADNVKFGRLVPQNLAVTLLCEKHCKTSIKCRKYGVKRERLTGFYCSKWWKKVFDCLYAGTLSNILKDLLTGRDTVWWWQSSEKWATRCDQWCSPLWWCQRILPAKTHSVTLTENSSSGNEHEAPAAVATWGWRRFVTLVAIPTALSSMVLLGLYPQSIM